ncbi:MAG: hypothetical protein ACYTGR_03535 [Planctomycetota bacterium]|jgi:hypothetical protein
MTRTLMAVAALAALIALTGVSGCSGGTPAANNQTAGKPPRPAPGPPAGGIGTSPDGAGG